MVRCTLRPAGLLHLKGAEKNPRVREKMGNCVEPSTVNDAVKRGDRPGLIVRLSRNDYI